MGAPYECLGQLFCALNLTEKNNGVARSFAQGNLLGYGIMLDQQQDVANVSYVFENGRMKASAYRALNTGDDTDIVLNLYQPYYVIIAVGDPGTTSARSWLSRLLFIADTGVSGYTVGQVLVRLARSLA